MLNKMCTKCGETKTTDQFNKRGEGLQSWCRECKAQNYNEKAAEINAKRKAEYREKHPLPVLPEGFKRCSTCGEAKPANNEFFGNSARAKDGLKHRCKTCRSEEYEGVSETRKVQARAYYRANKRKCLDSNKRYREENPEWYQDYNREYYMANKEKIIANSKKNIYLRISQDPVFKLLARCRTRVYQALKGNRKPARTIELVGCSIEHLTDHLEAQFLPGMTWENYGEWHVDHIRPCASFDFSIPAQVHECFYYTNLQPLWAKDNIRKSANY